MSSAKIDTPARKPPALRECDTPSAKMRESVRKELDKQLKKLSSEMTENTDAIMNHVTKGGKSLIVIDRFVTSLKHSQYIVSLQCMEFVKIHLLLNPSQRISITE